MTPPTPTKPTSNAVPQPAPQSQQQGLTPEGLTNQLFEIAISQTLAEGNNDPIEAARRVVGFLTDALFYAVKSMRSDFVVYLTETLIFAACASVRGDEAACKELLKHIVETISNATPPAPKPPASSVVKP